MLKPRKVASSGSWFRPLSLTSFIRNLKERLVHRRLTWILERYQVLRDELSGFRKERSAADSIAAISSALEETKVDRQTADIISRCMPCIRHPLIWYESASIAAKLHPKAYEALTFMKYFLTGTSFFVKKGGTTSSSKASQTGGTTGAPNTATGKCSQPLTFEMKPRPAEIRETYFTWALTLHILKTTSLLK